MAEAKKAPAKKEENKAMATYKEGSWGSENIDSEDLYIPQLRISQPQSGLVADGAIAMGKIYDSGNSDNIFGDEEKAVDVIIFGTFKKIWVFKNDEYEKTEEYTKDYEYEETDAKGDKIKRSLYMGFYCILPDNVKTKSSFPFILPFKSSAVVEGRKLATELKKLDAQGKPTAARVFSMKLKKEKNDKGTWFSPVMRMGRETTVDEMNAAYQWYQTLVVNKVQFKTDDEVPVQEEKVATPSQPSAPVEAQV